MSNRLPWMTTGDRDFVDEIRALVLEVGTPCDLDVMTGSVNPSHAATLARWRDAGEVSELRLVVDAGFLAKRDTMGQPAHAAVDEAVGRESVRAVRTHAKAARARGPTGEAVLICSANLNANRNVEFYERADAVAPTIERVIDGIFARCRPGCVGVSQAAAGAALREAVAEFKRLGVLVYDTAEPLPKAAISGERDGLIVLRGGALGGFLPAILARVGSPARVWSSGINVQSDQVHYLAREVVAGRVSDLRLWFPPKLAHEPVYAALFELVPDAVTWSNVHAKALIAEGPHGVVCCTGSAQLAGTGALEFVHLTNDRAIFDHVAAMLEAMPPVADPPEPSEEATRKARERFEAGGPQAAGRGGKASPPAVAWGIPASALAVSPDFQPFTGIAASDADLWDEHDRLAMLADLHEMIRWAWPKVNPGTVFVDNWHLHKLCRQYMAFVHGTCAETTLNAQPPGTGKSTIISQIGPVWGWLHYPHHRWGFASHSLAQAIKDSTFRRALIADPDFQRIFRPGLALPSWEIKAIPSPDMVATVRRSRAWRILKGKDGKALFGNTAAGYMRAASTGAKITGDHFDRLMGDDLLDGKDRAKPEGAVDWTVNVFFTRVRDGAMKWINGQRLHPRDPIGVLRDQAIEDGTLGVAGRGGVDYLCFPHHYAPDDPDRQCASSVGVTDQRTYKGELLDPRRFPESVLKAKSRDMGPLEAAAQLEQNTRLEAGMLFPADKWGRFGVDPGGGRLEVSVDSSNWSSRKGADLTSITLSRIVDGRVYRMAHWPPPVSGDWGKADRYSVTEVVDILAQLSLDYPMIGRWLVENKAGGMGLMQLMVAGGQIGGRPWRIHAGDIVAVNPQKAGGDLKFRADTAARAQNKGLCFVLTGAEGDKFIKDCADFPNVWPDDPIASWVQQVIDPEISLLLGHRPAPVKTPRPVVKAAAIQSRRGGGFR